MGDMLQMAMAARDPVREYLAAYYGARRLSQNEEERKQQLGEQQLEMRLRKMKEQADLQATEQKAFGEAVDEVADMAATQAKATGVQPDENWLSTVWAKTVEGKGLNLQKYPNPGPMGAAILQKAGLALTEYQAAKVKQAAEEAKAKREEEKAGAPVYRQNVEVGEDELWSGMQDPKTGQWVGDPTKARRFRERAGSTAYAQAPVFIGPDGQPLPMRWNKSTGGYEPAPVAGGAVPAPRTSPGRIDAEEAQKMLNAERARQQKAGAMADPEYLDANGKFSETRFQRNAPRKLGISAPGSTQAAGQVQVRMGTPVRRKLKDGSTGLFVSVGKDANGKEQWMRVG